MAIQLSLCYSNFFMTQKRFLSIIKFLFFLALGIALLWVSTRSLSEEEIIRVKQLIFSADLRLVIPSLLTLVLSHYVRALRWKMMIQPLGYQPATSNVFHAVLTGYFFNLLFPRLGEVMKCSLLARYEKVPVDRLIGTILAERIIDLFCLVAIIILTVLTQMERVKEYTLEIVQGIRSKIDFTASDITLFLFFLVVLFLFFRWLNKKYKGFGWMGKFINVFNGLAEGLTSVRFVSNKMVFMAYTILIWFLYLSSIRIGFWALQETSMLGWKPSLTVLTFGSFAMIATQGGIGAYQLVVQKTLVLYSINQVAGLAFGWLLWSVQTLLLFVMGPFSLFFMYINNKKKIKIQAKVS